MGKGNSTALRILPQVLLLGLVGVLQALIHWHVIPSQSYVLGVLQKFFVREGLAVVAVFSYIENIVGVNVYFPGSVVLLVAMSTTSGDLGRAILMYFVIYVPAVLGNISSYLLGRYGLAAARTKKIVSQQTGRGWWWAFLLTYWHPQLASVTAVAAGVDGLPFSRLLVLLISTTVPWSLFWAVLIYHLGSKLMMSTDFASLFVAYILVWIAWDLFKGTRRTGSGGAS